MRAGHAAGTWVLLRGLTRERRHWGPVPDMLRAAWPGVRVLTPDLPGNGSLHTERSPARVAAMVDAIRRQLREQGVAPPVHLLALSLGGMVAVEWAARWPAEVAGAVLVNTSLRPFSAFHQRLRPANYPALARLAWGGGAGPRAREQAILQLTSARPADHEALLDEWAAWRVEQPVSPSNAVRQLLAAARYRAPAQPPAVPMLVLASAGDRLVDPACSRRLAAAWGLPLDEHPHAGHDLPLDDPRWVVEQVTRWLAPGGG
ncbi:MAG: alpha/beta hydrolase [Vitreoscilla sp.]|nr:alpha/beta hydrolase [Vitreoscilla sp.]